VCTHLPVNASGYVIWGGTVNHTIYKNRSNANPLTYTEGI